MTQPPYYILFSHSSSSNSSPGATSNTLGHPVIQYQYANDSPLALWPQHPNEHVLVLDHNPTNSPTAQSISKDLAVMCLNIEEAPGAAAANENDPKNDRMYIIETTAIDGNVDTTSSSSRKSSPIVLEQFKRRNAILRRVLLYPSISGTTQSLPQISNAPS